jgi:hypothetical protein
MRIALYQGKSLISRAIRWQTRSQYSHAAFLLDDGSLIEAWQPCVREITPFPNLNRLAASKRSEDGIADSLSCRNPMKADPVRSNVNSEAVESPSNADAILSPIPHSALRIPHLAALSRQHTPGTTVDIFKFVIPLTPDENRQLEYLARRDVGTPYDYRAIVRFLTRQRDGSSRRLFCSEQVFARCQQIGRPLLNRTEPWRVPPDWLARSPHLALDQTIITA